MAVSARFLLAEEFNKLAAPKSVAGRLFDMPLVREHGGKKKSTREVFVANLEELTEDLYASLRSRLKEFGAAEKDVEAAVEKGVVVKARNLCFGYVCGVMDMEKWSETVED